MGPQDQKWRSMYYETASKLQERPNVDNVRNRLEEHMSKALNPENFQPTSFGNNEQYREVKRQNDFLKHYSNFSLNIMNFMNFIKFS